MGSEATSGQAQAQETRGLYNYIPCLSFPYRQFSLSPPHHILHFLPLGFLWCVQLLVPQTCSPLSFRLGLSKQGAQTACSKCPGCFYNADSWAAPLTGRISISVGGAGSTELFESCCLSLQSLYFVVSCTALVLLIRLWWVFFSPLFLWPFSSLASTHSPRLHISFLQKCSFLLPPCDPFPINSLFSLFLNWRAALFLQGFAITGIFFHVQGPWGEARVCFTVREGVNEQAGTRNRKHN